MRTPATLLLGLLLLEAACPPALADIALEVETRLPGLVGRDEGDARFVVDWKVPPPEKATVEIVRYDGQVREVEARLKTLEGWQTVTGKVMLIGLVPTPARPIAAGEPVAEADLGLLEIDLLATRQDIVRDAADIRDHAARRTLSPGKPILARDLKLVPAVARNAIVSLEAAIGSLRLKARGKALDGGAVGDTIRVQNIDSRRLVTGTIVAPGVVAVGG